MMHLFLKPGKGRLKKLLYCFWIPERRRDLLISKQKAKRSKHKNEAEWSANFSSLASLLPLQMGKALLIAYGPVLLF
jgi:hypothetical protein